MLLTLALTASAGTWLAGEMTEAGDHPRTLALPDERPLLRERAEREPYTSQVRQLASLAGRTHDLTDDSVGAVQSRGNTARAAAWLFYMDLTVIDGEVVPFPDRDSRLAVGARADTLLASMRTTSRAKGLSDAVLDIHTAQELHLWADTLDLLLGADEDALGPRRAEAIQDVADLAADLYADFHTYPNYLYTRSLLNNHRVKSMTALGQAAIALNGERWEAPVDDGRYDPSRWVDDALLTADVIARDVLTDEDGGYVEGGGYISYGGLELYPFLWAWHRYTGGADWTVTLDPSLPPEHVLGYQGDWTVPDLWTSPWLSQQLDWSLRTLLPDGSAPPTDDSTPGARLYYGAFVSPDFPHAGLYQWAWERGGLAAGGSVDVAPFLIAAHDDSVPAISPVEAGWSEDQVLFSAGQVMLRSGWEEGATVALMLAEHGEASAWSRTRWGQDISANAGHEHPDALSVAVWSGGEPLLIDGGYLGWPDHHLVNKPDNHSLILIDGEGPQGARAVIPPVEVVDDQLVLADPSEEGGWCHGLDGEAWVVSEDLTDPALSYARAVTRYTELAPQADLSRSLVLLAGRYPVFLDRAQPWTCAVRRYTHQLHTHCGGTSGGTLTEVPHGVRCARGQVEALVLVLGQEGMTLDATREELHDAGGWAQRTHAVLQAEVDIPKARFLTLALPGVDTVEEVGENGLRWEDDERACEAWTEEERPPSPLLPALIASAGVVCQEEGLLYGLLQGTPEDEEAELSFTATLAGEALTGWRVKVHDHRDAALTLTLPALPGLEPDGACAWTEAAGSWTLQVPREARTAPQARAHVAVARAYGVFPGEAPALWTGESTPLYADWSCGEAEPVWTLTRRPERSHAEVRDGSLTPDLPGLYELSLDYGGDTHTLRLEATGAPSEPDEPVDTGLPEDTGPGDTAQMSIPGDERGCARLVNRTSGCGCASGALSGALPWALAVALGVRRRRR
ncbi:MAG: heparinase II/III family protein [Deltaproteobacteria bacterium]|nr:heparinase II/III family protein [Deltaproteobacteria bacterium]